MIIKVTFKYHATNFRPFFTPPSVLCLKVSMMIYDYFILYRSILHDI